MLFNNDDESFSAMFYCFYHVVLIIIRPLNLGELLTVRFDHNIIQNTNFLGDAVEHSLASKLSLFTL